VLTCAPEHAATLAALAAEHGVAAYEAGVVGEWNGQFHLRLRDAEIAQPVARLRDVYFSAIPRRMGD
jgi:hypothetical protein